MMTISCDVDFHFDDGTTARTLVCRENGAWHVMPIPQCKGRSLYLEIYESNKLSSRLLFDKSFQSSILIPFLDGYVSLFRRPIIPTTHCSDSPLFRRSIVSTAHYSDGPLFRPQTHIYIHFSI